MKTSSGRSGRTFLAVSSRTGLLFGSLALLLSVGLQGCGNDSNDDDAQGGQAGALPGAGGKASGGGSSSGGRTSSGGNGGEGGGQPGGDGPGGDSGTGGQGGDATGGTSSGGGTASGGAGSTLECPRFEPNSGNECRHEEVSRSCSFDEVTCVCTAESDWRWECDGEMAPLECPNDAPPDGRGCRHDEEDRSCAYGEVTCECTEANDWEWACEGGEPEGPGPGCPDEAPVDGNGCSRRGGERSCDYDGVVCECSSDSDWDWTCSE